MDGLRICMDPYLCASFAWAFKVQTLRGA